MLLENMDEMKENYMGSVTEGDSILKKTDEADMPTFSGQKIKLEVQLLMDEVVGGCASVCVCVCFCGCLCICMCVCVCVCFFSVGHLEYHCHS
jgi:hypothetical protein